MWQVDYKDFIEVNPNIRFGKTVIKGTRIAVSDVLSWLSSGMTIAQITDDFPQLIDKLDFLKHISISAKIEKALEQLAKGEFLTSRQLDGEIAKW